jgi:hypothetical protein
MNSLHKYEQFKNEITEYGKIYKSNGIKINKDINMEENMLVIDHEGGYYYVKDYEKINESKLNKSDYTFPFLCNL